MDVTHLSRFEELSHYLIEHGFGDVFIRTKILDDLTFFEKLAVWLEKKDSLPTRLKKFAVHTGPTMVQFIKYLSTRTDIFPQSICNELKNISYTTNDDDLHRRKILLHAKNSQNIIKNMGYRYNPNFAEEFTFKISNTNYKGLGETQFDGIIYECNIVSSKSPFLKNKKGLYYAYSIDRQLHKQYTTDIEILTFFAEKIDLHYHFTFSARKLVADFKNHIQERIDLHKVKQNTTTYLASLSSLPKTKHRYQILQIEYTTPRYLTQFCNTNQIIFWSSQEYTLQDILQHKDETENSTIASIPKKAMVENVSEILFAPIFTHGYMLTDIQPQDIIITKQGKASLQIARNMHKMTYEQTTKLSLVLASLLTQDIQEIKKLFPKSKLEKIQPSLTTSDLEVYINYFAKEHTLNHEYFQIIELLNFIQKIAKHTQVEYNALQTLKEYINQHLAHALEKNFTFNKKEVLIQPLKSQIKKMHFELNFGNPQKYHSALANIGYMILLLFSFLIIASAIVEEIKYEYVIIAFLLITFAYMIIMAKEERKIEQK
jgi:predicted unusual protein kinase regulating ubiquinone biosynthesis (AarF/ABC1/UbiB family)